MLLAALALALAFEDASGKTVKLDEPGMVYLVDFWLEGCAPCMEEMPELLRLAKDLEPQGRFKLVSVLWGGASGGELRRIAKRNKISHAVYSDPDKWLEKVGKPVFPTKVLVRDGQILLTRVGGLRGDRETYEYWKEKFEKALTPSEPTH